MTLPKKKTSTKTQTRKKQDGSHLEKKTKIITVENIFDDIKINIKFKFDNQRLYTELIREKDMVIASGPAGVGKTFLTCAEAISLLKKYPDIYEKIVLVKSVTTLKDEELGYLKGDLKNKMEPFIYSFINNFEKLIGHEKTCKLEEFRKLEVIPIAYMRGINIDNSIIIIDETQNISVDNIHTIMTRLGQNSKMIFLGDVNQVDSRNKKDSALKFIISQFSALEEIGIIEFTTDDIVRHPLVKKIEEIFLKYKDSIK